MAEGVGVPVGAAERVVVEGAGEEAVGAGAADAAANDVMDRHDLEPES
ncbi:hypothetical protein ACFYZ8_30285 [Streptomyces sp. NPDC001668]